MNIHKKYYRGSYAAKFHSNTSLRNLSNNNPKLISVMAKEIHAIPILGLPTEIIL